MHTHTVLPGQGASGCLYWVHELCRGRRRTAVLADTLSPSLFHTHTMCLHSWDWELCSLYRFWPPLQHAPHHSMTAAMVLLSHFGCCMKEYWPRYGTMGQQVRFTTTDLHAVSPPLDRSLFWKGILHSWAICFWHRMNLRWYSRKRVVNGVYVRFCYVTFPWFAC